MSKNTLHTTRLGRDEIPSILQKAGVAVATGALVLSMVPLSAFAETGSTTSGDSTMQSAPSDGGGTPPDMPDGEGGPGEGGGGGGANTMTYDYSGDLSGALTADGEEVTSEGEAIDAAEVDQNAALAQNAGTLTITNGTLTKSGDDTDGDNCNFYGLNSIVLAVNEGSMVTISDSTLDATSEGSNAIFATDNATVYAANDTITTSADNSRGLDATYGGTIIATGMDITTQGAHCASIATDRGGGSISVTDSTLSTAGSGSPLLYSTGDIEVSNVQGTATGSQIAGMEGLNTILINNSNLTSTATDKTASDPIADGIIIYQSTSGDAESSTGEAATFQVVGSTLTSAIESGSMFYVTNTTANILVQATTLDFDADAADLLYVAGNDDNGWGTAGENGGVVTFTARDEQMAGDIEADTISTVTVYLCDNSTWTGAASIFENAEGSTSDAPITINVEAGSTWVVTEDSTISALNVADGASVVDEDGNQVTIVANGETVVEGTSSVTVTCDSYGANVDTSGASTASTDLIDRTAFDEAMGTDTAFTMGDASAAATDDDADAAVATDATADDTTTDDDAAGETDASSSDSGGGFLDGIAEFFKGIGDFFAGLFS